MSKNNKNQTETKNESKKVVRDRFGNRKGTRRNLVNEVLFKSKGRPVSIEVLVEKSGVPRLWVRWMVNELVKKGLVTEGEKGVQVKKESKQVEEQPQN